MAKPNFPQRLVELAGMLQWAVFDGRFEHDDERRIPIARALTFAWDSVNVLGEFGVKRYPCGCERGFGRPRILCWPHAGLDD
jgi:hypothetical protein